MPFTQQIPDGVMLTARIQRGLGLSWRAIAEGTGYTHEGIRYALNREAIRAQRAKRRAENKLAKAK